MDDTGASSAPSPAQPPGSDGLWRFAAASAIGPAHLAANGICEDAWFCGEATNGIAIATVSDGAGSAKHGALAARRICDSFAQLLAKLEAMPFAQSAESITALEPAAKLTKRRKKAAPRPPSGWEKVVPLVHQSLKDVRASFSAEAESETLNLDDYLATLVCVIAHPVLGAIIFHIGDGAVVVFDAQGTTACISQPENGEYLNQTYFLADEDWEQHCRTLEVPAAQVDTIFLMSDGVTDLGFHRKGRELTPEDGFFRPLCSFLDCRNREEGERGLAAMLDSARARELVDDDKTVAWMKRSADAPSAS